MTAGAVLTAIFHLKPFESMPLLAVLRSAGTTSMIAGDIGLKGPRIDALHKLLNGKHLQDHRTTVLQRPVLKVQVPSEKDPIYGMFFGTAAIYQASLFCNQKIHARGMRGELAAGMALIRFLIAVGLRDHNVVSGVTITARLNQTR